MNKDIVITFPHLANYYIPFAIFISKGLNFKVMMPPPITKKTLELGSKYSPDFVCAPFKYNLGNFIESLDLGATAIMQINGGCKVGYYGELQETILKDLGYDFKFIDVKLDNLKDLKKIAKNLKEENKNIKLFRVLYYGLLCIKMIKYIDLFEDFLRKNIGFEINKGEFEKLHKLFLEELKSVGNFSELKRVFKHYYKKMKKIAISKPNNLLKVGVVGELYTLMDHFSNHDLEKELAKKGVEITRYVNLDYLFVRKGQKEQKLLRKKNKYLKYNLAAGGTDSVVKSLKMAKEKYDGIIHVKATFCTPEINAMPILQNISNDYKIPIMYFSFDTSTSDIGIKTRIEAFYDMIEMRRQNE